jgi:hypothetical protein
MAADTRKISTKIWRPVVDKLTRKLEKACLRRDAFLERVLEVELPYLDEEVVIPNEEVARRFVAERLDQLDRKLVSLSLPSELVSRLDELCERKRIVRDAFFNRLFFLLAAPRPVIDRIFFLTVPDWRTEVWSERKHEGPFFQNVFYPLEPDVDPFWPIRTGLELLSDDSDLVEISEPASGKQVKVRMDRSGRRSLPDRVYTIVFDNEAFKDADLFGLNCHVPVWRIPGHPEQLTYRKELDELLGDFLSASSHAH